MSPVSGFSRRELLGSAALGGAGLFVAFHVSSTARAALPPAKGALPPPNAFVRISPDEKVTVVLAHSEMGQGTWTGLSQLIADELDADWSKVHAEHAPASPVYAHLGFGTMATGGSSSMNSEFMRYRQAGAVARAMLVEAAAKQWKTDARKLRTDNGFVLRGKGDAAKDRLSYGSLAEAAQKLAPPTAVKLKEPKEWKLIGKPTRRLDGPEKITGKAIFGMDIQFPGLRTALVARGPVFGAKVKSFDGAKAKAVPGVEQVLQIPSGVAVVASNFWAAKVGRDALSIDWDLGPGADVDSDAMKTAYSALAKTPGTPAKVEGDAEAGLAAAASRVTAEYDVPYLAHAPMEPLNCTVKIENGTCELWVGTQFQQIDQGAAAAITGFSPDKVTVHTPFLGGGFGRRGSPRADFTSEAVIIAKLAGVPVKTVWTREDDIRGGYYRPAFLHRIEVGTDAAGMPKAWKHTIVGQSIGTGTMFEGFIVHNGIDGTSVEGAADSPYLEKIPAKNISLHSPKNAVPVHFWRSVGATHTAFAVESMVDELAHAAGKDPLAYRQALLAGNARFLKVLNTAAEKAGWGTPLAAGRARGIALHESFGSIAAQVAEVSVEGKEIRVHKVFAAIDCGFAVNPLAVEAQAQGSISYGLSAALHSEVTFKGGRAQQSNFHDYQVLRLYEMPEVSVTIINSGEKMGGVGEPSTPTIFPAVANAVFALTKQRLRSLPLRLA